MNRHTFKIGDHVIATSNGSNYSRKWANYRWMHRDETGIIVDIDDSNNIKIKADRDHKMCSRASNCIELVIKKSIETQLYYEIY